MHFSRIFLFSVDCFSFFLSFFFLFSSGLQFLSNSLYVSALYILYTHHIYIKYTSTHTQEGLTLFEKCQLTLFLSSLIKDHQLCRLFPYCGKNYVDVMIYFQVYYYCNDAMMWIDISHEMIIIYNPAMCLPELCWSHCPVVSESYLCHTVGLYPLNFYFCLNLVDELIIFLLILLPSFPYNTFAMMI